MLSIFSSAADAHTCPIPRAQFQLTLKRWGRDRRSLTLMDKPIRVAMLQCGMVGVKATATVFSGSLTWLGVGGWNVWSHDPPSPEPLFLVCGTRQVV